MAWWQVVAVTIISTFGTVAVAKVAARSSDRASERTATAAGRATEVDGMDRLIGRLEARLAAVEEDATEARAEAAECRRENAALQARVASLEDDLRDTRATLRDSRTRFGPVSYTHLRAHET